MANFACAMACAIFSSVIFHPVGAAAAAPPEPMDCSTVTFGMMDCLGYVSAGSEEDQPDDSCCEGVLAAAQLGPPCLCEALREAAFMNVNLNISRAARLAAACHVYVPPSANCTAARSPRAGEAPAAPRKPQTAVSYSPSPSPAEPRQVVSPSDPPTSTLGSPAPVEQRRPSSPAEPPASTLNSPATGTATMPSTCSSLAVGLVSLVICVTVAAACLRL